MRFRRALIAVIAVPGLWILAGGSALATSHIMKKVDPKIPKTAIAKAVCPTGYKVQGTVTAVSQGGTAYTCVPNIPTITCGPGTEYFAEACKFGCKDKALIPK